MPLSPREFYDRTAASYDADWGLDDLPADFRERLAAFVEEVPGPRVLDAGCGAGRDVAYFAGRGLDPVGVDVARGMVERARERRAGAYVRGDVRASPFATDAFDGLWCPTAVFLLAPDGMARALASFARVLRPGGVGVVGFKLGDGPATTERDGLATVQHRVSEDRARALLAGAGLDPSLRTVNRYGDGRAFALFDCRA